jgi:hypothetical protein
VEQKGSEEMSPRIGRPKVDNPKTMSVRARLDSKTYEQLVQYCKDTGKTITSVVVEGIETVLGIKK